MANSILISSLKNVAPKKDKVTNPIKGMFEKISRSNPFSDFSKMKKQIAGNVVHTAKVRKLTPRSGKK